MGEGCSDTTEVTQNLCQRKEPSPGLSQQGLSIKRRLWMQFKEKNLMAEKGPTVLSVVLAEDNKTSAHVRGGFWTLLVVCPI